MQVRAGQRGVALVETAVCLPLFLIVMFGIIWAVQSSVQSERVQMAVRFSGLVSNQASPYVDYSLYALYNAATAPGVSTGCIAPTSDALTNTGTFPGPAAPSFFSPINGSTSGTCQKGTAQLSGGALTTPVLFLQTTSNISTQVTVPTFLAPVLAGNTALSASENFFDTPDLGTIMQCYTSLRSAVTASLEDQAQGAIMASAPLPDVNPTSALTINGGC